MVKIAMSLAALAVERSPSAPLSRNTPAREAQTGMPSTEQFGAVGAAFAIERAL